MKRLLMSLTAVLLVFAVCSVAWAETVPVQFRLGENEPGKDLEEMMVSGTDRKIYLHKESIISNADIETASVQITNTGVGIGVTLTEAGGKKLAEITKDNVGKVMGIVVDSKLISAPVIHAPITGGKAIIKGNFDLEEAERIANSFGVSAKVNEKAPLPDNVSYDEGALVEQGHLCAVVPSNVEGLRERERGRVRLRHVHLVHLLPVDE